MTLYLEIRSPGAEMYPIHDYPEDLENAIAAEAQTIADDAGSELLDDPGETARNELRREIIDQASVALRDPGDTYRDVSGVTWVLIEEKD